MNIGGKQITKQVALKYVGFVVLGLIVLGILTYLFLIQKEKAQFAQAEKEIDALYAQIVEKIGKPDQEKKEKSCDRPNLKFEKGPLSCSVGMSILFENKTLQESNVILAKVTAISSEQLRMGSAATKGSTFTDSIRKDWDQRFFQRFSSKTPLSCNLSYTYPSAEQDDFELKSTSALLIGLDCYRSALSEYFPLKD